MNTITAWLTKFFPALTVVGVVLLAIVTSAPASAQLHLANARGHLETAKVNLDSEKVNLETKAHSASEATIEKLRERYFLALQVEQQNHDDFVLAHSLIAAELSALWQDPNYHQGVLAFNIANSWQHAKRYGLSIYWYQQAIRHGYSNHAVWDNLRLAQRQRTDDLPNWFDNAWLDGARQWVNDPYYPWLPKCLFILFLVASYFSIVKQKPWATTLGAAALFLCSYTLPEMLPNISSHGVIISPEAVVRKGPSDLFAPAFQHPLHDGTEFITLQQQQDWLLVSFSNQQHGWLNQHDIALYQERWLSDRQFSNR